MNYEESSHNIHVTEPSDLEFYKAKHISGLEGKRFAVRVKDNSLDTFGIEPGSVVIGLRTDVIEPLAIYAVEVFSIGIVFRLIECCEKCKEHCDGDKCYQLKRIYDGRVLCRRPDEFHIIGKLLYTLVLLFSFILSLDCSADCIS